MIISYKKISKCSMHCVRHWLIKIEDGNKFVLKTLISRRMSYFVGILRGVVNIFLLGYRQVFFPIKHILEVFLNHIKIQFKEENHVRRVSYFLGILHGDSFVPVKHRV